MPEIPHMPVTDIGLGLASAVLLLLAAFLLARSRAEHAFHQHMRDFEPDLLGLFKELDVAGTEKRLSLIASLFLHILGVALIPWLDLALSWRPAPLPNYKLITLDYRRPLPPVVRDSVLFEPDLNNEDRPEEDADPAVDSQETPTKGEREGRTGDPQQADDQNASPDGAANLEQTARDAPPEADDQNAGADGEANLEQTARDAPPKPPDPSPSPEPEAEQEVQLLLPELRNTDPSLRDIVLHPEFTAELPRSHELDIPPTLLWTPELSKLEPLTILEPTAEAPDTPVQDDLPAVQPQVRTPNEESRLSSLQMRQLTLENDNPALTVPPADVTPLAALEGAEDAQTAPSITGEEGLNSLVALSARPDIESTLFDLLPGLRLGSIAADIRRSPDEPLGASGSESGDNRESTPAEQSQPEGAGLDRGFDSGFLIGEGFTELGVESGSDDGRPRAHATWQAMGTALLQRSRRARAARRSLTFSVHRAQGNAVPSRAWRNAVPGRARAVIPPEKSRLAASVPYPDRSTASFSFPIPVTVCPRQQEC